MEKLKFKEVFEKLKNDEFNPYNFYNIDYSSDQILSINHYLEHPSDNIDKTQILHKCFLDIEVYLNNDYSRNLRDVVNDGKNIVNAMTHYYTSEDKYYLYFIPPENFSKSAGEMEEYLNKEAHTPTKVGENEDGSDKLDTYLKENQSVKVQFFENDKDLIVSFFNKLKESDPAAICGWNSSGFDIPYLYHRLLYFYGSPEEVSKIISRFDIVEERSVSDRMGKKSPKIIIPEYLDMDLMNLYKPRADGGQKVLIPNKNKILFNASK